MQTVFLKCLPCVAGLLAAGSLALSPAPHGLAERRHHPSSSVRAPQPCGMGDGVTVIRRETTVDNVVDSERRKITKAPVILLRRGQTYRVEQRYTGHGAERTAFNKWSVSRENPKGFWDGQGFLDSSKSSGGNQGDGVLNAADFPSGKCLITFWAFDENVPLHRDKDGSRHREVPYVGCTKESRTIQGRSVMVYTFEYRDDYTTAKVDLYRAQ